MKLSYRLSAAVALVMVLQAALGLAAQSQYRDVGWIRLTWLGNDWVTLALAAPLLITALAMVRRGSMRGALLWIGLLGYAIYNYAFYLLGAALNVFFPLYVLALVLAAAALIVALVHLDTAAVAASFRPGTPVRLIGGYLVFLAAGLSCVWLGLWAAYIFAERPAPGGTDVFQVVAALDLTLMVPALACGGILLWRRHPWGHAVAALASVQGSLYLLVLTVNSALAVRQGLVEAPGELPLWAGLALPTAVAAALLLRDARATQQVLAGSREDAR